MPAANGKVIHPIMIMGLENSGVTANNPTTAKKSASRKIRPGQCVKASLKTPSFFQ